MLAAILSIVGYFAIAVLVKSYYKLYRFKDPMDISPEEPYLIGLGWPVYFIYRLIAWPFVSFSRFVEKKLESSKEAKEEVKVRVSSRTEREIAEAEQEIEEMLAKRNSL